MKRLPAAVLVVALLLAQCAAVHAASQHSASPPDHPDVTGGGRPYESTLTIVIRDGVTDEEVPARVSVVDVAGQPAHPLPAASCFYHHPYGDTPGYFYSRGRSSLFVANGETVVTITRGFEYETVIDTVGVRQDTTVTYHLNKWVDMNALGHYSGDCHTHAEHSGSVYVVEPDDAFLMATAEDLDVLNCLDIDYFFTGAPDTCSTAECIVFMSEEHRSSVYGHSDLLGISELITPPSTLWWPLLMDVADSVHAQGGAIISAHPVSTDDFFDLESVSGKMLARELPLDVARYKIDGYELLSGYSASHRRTRDMWYRILNCGFRMPACAGTDALLGAAYGKPAGSMRVYVTVPGEFTYDSWLANMLAGRTFVTNGPLFTDFQVRNFDLGDSVNIYSSGVAYLNGHVRAECETPLWRVDIMCNGQIRKRLPAAPGQCVIDTTFVIPVYSSSWVAARASGPKAHMHTIGDSLFAHSGPVYFSLNDRRILEPQSAGEMVDWVEDLERLAWQSGEWTVPGHGARLISEIARAHAYYSALAEGAATGVEAAESAGPTRPSLAVGRPNPFAETAEFSYSVPGEGHARLTVFSPSGRLVRSLIDGRASQGMSRATWDGRDEGGLPCASGVYLCRLEAFGDVITRKVVLLR